MTRALVVYESYWGNTEQVAREVAAGIADVMPVDVLDVSGAPPDLHGVDLLVAGGPTHAFSMTSEATRRDVRGLGAMRGTLERGLREWLSDLPRSSAAVATFDTRVSAVRHLPGSAAPSAGREARRHGLRRAGPPASFWVEGTQGPLVDGELGRARVWGHGLAQSLGAAG